MITKTTNLLMIFHNLIKKYINIFNFILAIVGILMVSWIIWIRFIRERLPKDIPFDLSEIRFYLIAYACIIYLIIIYSLLSLREPNIIIKKLVEILFLPLVTFDKFIKNNKYITAKYIKFLEKYIKPKLVTTSWFVRLHIENRYIFITIVPRCILILILLVEVFYFKRIEIFYSAIILGILPLLHRYLKYSFKNIKEQYIYYFEQQIKQIYILIEDAEEENNYEKNPEKYPEIKYHAEYITVRQYFEDVLSDDYKYFVSPEFKEDYLNKYIYENEISNKKEILNKEQIIDKLKRKFRLEILPCGIMESYYELYAEATNTSYIKWLRIIIFSLYFICWFYILCVSFHTLKNMPITINILNVMIENIKEDPFLQTIIDIENYD